MASEVRSSQEAPQQPPLQTLQTLSLSITQQAAKGVSVDALVQELMEQGWAESSARRFVLNAVRAVTQQRRIGSEARVSQSRMRMLRGLLWVLAGLGILLISLEVPHLTGGIPLLYLGAIVIGFFDFFIGLLNWREEQE